MKCIVRVMLFDVSSLFVRIFIINAVLPLPAILILIFMLLWHYVLGMICDRRLTGKDPCKFFKQLTYEDVDDPVYVYLYVQCSLSSSTSVRQSMFNTTKMQNSSTKVKLLSMYFTASLEGSTLLII
ncbi:hypothetical protein VNO78_19689 [Psophocarpus tetragonolobus]|uniref:Uncharacterized protein n=1 Tax=Psophocarpus tetragonolobus TaxID=3891 RepID=A0AAN9S8Z1_PSOTE